MNAPLERRWDLRLGDFREVLADVEADTLCTDTPWSKRTHTGFNRGTRKDKPGAGQGSEYVRTDKRTGRTYPSGRVRVNAIDFAHWGPEDVERFVAFWRPRIRSWWVIMTDHVLAREWERCMLGADLYVFAPLVVVGKEGAGDRVCRTCGAFLDEAGAPIPVIQPGRSVRLAGDGPSSWLTWIVVARPQSMKKWRTTPGAYLQGRGEAERVGMVGGKPRWICRDLVADYSNPGDSIVDPCAGLATIGVEAILAGRRYIGAEVNTRRFTRATNRLLGTETYELGRGGASP